jgi:hypothetical protein
MSLMTAAGFSRCQQSVFKEIEASPLCGRTVEFHSSVRVMSFQKLRHTECTWAKRMLRVIAFIVKVFRNSVRTFFGRSLRNGIL